MADVLVIGELLAEIMANEVGQRFDTPGIFLGPYPSGAPGIFIDQVANVGVSCTMVGCVGKDGFGDQIINRLKKDGVDTSHIKRADSLPTGTAFVTYKQDGSREFIFNIGNSAAGLLNEEMVDEKVARHCKYFHVMGSFLSTDEARKIIFKTIKIVQENGGKISFDPNVRAELFKNPGTKEAILEVLEYTSIFLPSDIDLKFLFGEVEEKPCVEKLLQKYPFDMIVVKKAVLGATYYDRNQTIETSAFKVTEVDPTGAGDAFGGAFIGCIVKNMPIEQSLKIACAAGAMAVSKKGPMEGVVSLKDLESLIASS